MWSNAETVRAALYSPVKSAVAHLSDDAQTQLPSGLRAGGELVEPREAWLPQEARELFTAASRLLRDDPYLLHAPANTQRARRGDWALFCLFCESRGVPAMPASPRTVVAFLEAVQTAPPLPGGRPRREHISDASLARRERRALAAALPVFRGRPRASQRAAKTLERYMTTVATAHRLADQPDPTRTARVRNALHALMAGLRSAKPRAPLRRWHLLELMAGLCPPQREPSWAGRYAEVALSGVARHARRGWRAAKPEVARLWDLRARAVLACLYPTMARRSELLELRYEDFALNDSVPIHSRKTRQQEHRFVDGLALKSVRDWCKAANIRSGPVFRELDSRGRIGEHAISGAQVAQIVRACWAHRVHQIADREDRDAILSAALIPDLGGHSARIGATHDMLASGEDLLAIMHAGGWKDPRMPRKYIQELQATDSGMARMLGRSESLQPQASTLSSDSPPRRRTKAIQTARRAGRLGATTPPARSAGAASRVAGGRQGHD